VKVKQIKGEIKNAAAVIAVLQLNDCCYFLTDESIQTLVLPDYFIIDSVYFSFRASRRKMIQGDNHQQIDALLHGNYLLYNMIPSRKSFYSADFLNYYFLLFQHLMQTGQFEAKWLLHAAVKGYVVYHEVSSQKRALWHAFYTYPASHVAEIIDEVIANDKDTEDLITWPLGL